jgi:hypothetical protein
VTKDWLHYQLVGEQEVEEEDEKKADRPIGIVVGLDLVLCQIQMRTVVRSHQEMRRLAAQ